MSEPKTILKWGATDYELVPVQDPHRSSQASRLRKFDDASLAGIRPYKYKQLEGEKKKIRLLELKRGTIDSPDITCELMEANYDNVFHIPIIGGSQSLDRSDIQHKVKAQHPDIKDGELLAKLELYEALSENEIKYEALSWCWGKDKAEYALLVSERSSSGQEETYKLRVRKELALALKHLRHAHKSRTMWIDAICIDQENPSERNHQVQMMSRIYTRSEEVCIWLGDSDDSSKLAIDFIRDEIMELRNFDALSKGKQYTDKWKALMMLMQREWFSRRWVVQEIALANKATIHCGADKISWKKFSVAVELFVEVETATHRLSEIMQKDEKFRHIPGWFEYVSELGASLLVQATGKVFRAQRSPLEVTGHQDENYTRKKLIRDQTIDPLDRRSLLSLEYLVSTMFIFQASEPRDTIYAMLAISRDAAPIASSGETIRDHHDNETRLIMTVCESFLEEKPFTIDYRRPYADVCKDFIQFAIERKDKLDPAQALDILCRPWALEPRPGGKSLPARLKTTAPKTKIKNSERKARVYYLDKAPVEGGRPNGGEELCWEDIKKEPPTESWNRMKRRYFPDKHPTVEGPGEKGPEETRRDEQGLSLPSWISRASQAPFSLDHSPGIDIQKTGRANADPLVGHSQDGHRNYSAAQTQKVRPLLFRRRPQMGTYSLYVQGFVLDEVETVMDASQGGNIPKSWLGLAKWPPVPANTEKQDSPVAADDEQGDPPGELWRTLVADRGKDNRNPPYYYARACRESVYKGGIAGGRVDTAALINNERNSIVAEFCRRVHAVIWNRRLFKTKNGRLGLARDDVKKGDQICILYGCTVPVVVQSHKKTPPEPELADPESTDSESTDPGLTDPEVKQKKTRSARELEREEDSVEALKRVLRNLERRCEVIHNHNAKVAKGKSMKEDIEKAKARIEKEQLEKYKVKEGVFITEEDLEKLDIAREKAISQEFEKYKVKEGVLTAEDLKDLDAARKKATEMLERMKFNDKAHQGSPHKEIKDLMDDPDPRESADPLDKQNYIPPWNGEDPTEERPPKSAKRSDASGRRNLSTPRENVGEPRNRAVEEAGSRRGDLSTDEQEAPDALIGSSWSQEVESEDEGPGENNAVSGPAPSTLRRSLRTPTVANGSESSAGAGASESIQPLQRAKTISKEKEETARSDAPNHWYTFKGECYLHGMMDGEAIRERIYQDIVDQVFELR